MTNNSVTNIDNDSSINNSRQSKFTKDESTSTANTSEALIITETFLIRTKLKMTQATLLATTKISIMMLNG